MNLAVCGYGKMGRLIKELALERDHTVRIIDPAAAGADFAALDATSLKGIDVCIDFTHPLTALDNLRVAAGSGCSMVMGTTGWYDRVKEARAIVAKAGTGFLYASNFSIGVNLFYKMVEHAAVLMDHFEQYDVSGVEFHHNQKADSPSGTADSLAELLLGRIRRKNQLVFDRIDGKIAPEDLHFASVRCGSIPGTHEIVFDSDADTISLKHTARNRRGFAAGALAAAEWLRGRKGFFSLEDLLRDIIPANNP